MKAIRPSCIVWICNTCRQKPIFSDDYLNGPRRGSKDHTEIRQENISNRIQHNRIIVYQAEGYIQFMPRTIIPERRHCPSVFPTPHIPSVCIPITVLKWTSLRPRLDPSKRSPTPPDGPSLSSVRIPTRESQIYSRAKSIASINIHTSWFSTFSTLSINFQEDLAEFFIPARRTRYMVFF